MGCWELRFLNGQELHPRLVLHNGDKWWWEAVLFLRDGLTVFFLFVLFVCNIKSLVDIPSLKLH